MSITPRHILDKDGMNDKFTWEDIESAQKSFDAKKFPEMQKYADFLNSEEVSREKICYWKRSLYSGQMDNRTVHCFKQE